MNNVRDFVTTIKRELLLEIVTSLKHKAMPKDSAIGLAREFVNKGPFKNREDVLEKLAVLSKDYEEARNVFLKYAPSYYEAKRVCLLTTIRTHVGNGELDLAVQNAYGRCVA